MMNNANKGAGFRSVDDRILSDLSWEADIVLNARRSRTTAWIVAGCAMTVVLVMSVALAVLVPLKKVVPTVVMIDKLTGENQILSTAQDYVMTNTLSDKHWLQQFVVARERYVFRFIQYDYDTVRRLASNQVWANYAPLFDGNDSLDKRLRDDVEMIPNILSITLTDNRTATVRYELRTRDYRSTAPPIVTRRIATVRYTYETRNLVAEKDAIANPLGFSVTAYQTDAEMGGEAGSSR